MEADIKSRNIEDEFFLVDDDEEGRGASKYLLFNLGEEEYGVDIAKVTGIEELQKITHIPGMPEFMKGVINLRGRVIPVIDLRLRFGMVEKEYDDRTCIVITDIKDVSVGLIVDTVTVVMDMNNGSIDPPPSFKSGSGKDRYIQGLARIEDSVKILVDVEKIIHDDDIKSLKNEMENRGNE